MRSIRWQAVTAARRFERSIRNRGWRRTFELAADAALSLFWLERNVLRFHIPVKNVDGSRRPPPNVEMREVEPRDYPECLEFSVHFTEKEMLERFALGHRCIIARTEGRIIFYGWIGRNTAYAPILARRLVIPLDTAYFYNTYSDSAHRDKRLLPTFISWCKRFCDENDIHWGFTLVDCDIGVPVRAYSTLVSADEIRHIRYRRRLGVKDYSERSISVKEAASLSTRKYR